LDRIVPFWHELNRMMGQKSGHFTSFTSAALGRDEAHDRGEGTGDGGACGPGPRQRGAMRLLHGDADAGGVGEIDSLSVANGTRDKGIGDELMRRAVRWLDEGGAKRKRLGVTVGNEPVLQFCARHGFHPRMWNWRRRDVDRGQRNCEIL
jgi:GNAT superfamily N-acetyltransferase